MATERLDSDRLQSEKLAELQTDTELTEARSKLAEARSKLAEAEGGIAKARMPWWLRGLTLAGLATIVTAMVPLTAQILSWKDQRIKLIEKNFEIRDKYLTTVMRDPRQEQRVLGFIVATTDDPKVQVWANGELERVQEKFDILEDRKRLYVETIKVVSNLGDAKISDKEWEKQLQRFRSLYETELLPVESPEVENLMVKIRTVLDKCHPPKCEPSDITQLQNFAYQIARQMKAEIRADASPGAARPLVEDAK